MIYKGKAYKMVIVDNPVGSGKVQIYDQELGITKLEAGATMATVKYKAGEGYTNTTDVPRAVQMAFLNGSMFGWECDGADPYYCEEKEL